MAITSTTTTGGSSRFRTRKLNHKAGLPILRERDLEPSELGTGTANGTPGPPGEADGEPHAVPSIRAAPALTPADFFGGLPKVESGVESKEEKEHHLQAVISASAAKALGGQIAEQIYIPVPGLEEAVSRAQYDKLYPATFAQPVTYIRFSSTVEDCAGIPYNMTEDDDIWLKELNTKRKAGKGAVNVATPGSAQCSEDWFEQVMNSFEETSTARQPFAAVDNTPVLEYDEMSAAFNETVDEGARKFAPAIYEYWKAARLKRGNRPLVAKLKTLKMDAVVAEADDSDPYVCFRRREVRQQRRTRGARDMQVGEKLKKLRKELEEGRHLLDLVRQREVSRKEDLALGRSIFEKRLAVRSFKDEHKIDINIEDELLITQRTPKKKPIDVPPPLSTTAIRPSQAHRLSLLRTDSVASATAAAAGLPEADSIVSLRERIRDREARIAQEMADQMAALEALNERFVDHTEEAILGLYLPMEVEAARGDSGSWVSAKVEVTQQPTPPQSVVSGDEEEDEDVDLLDADISSDEQHQQLLLRRQKKMESQRLRDILNLRWATDSESSSSTFRIAPRYRKRHGRGGRLLVDRRFPRDAASVAKAAQRFGTDRWKFDRDSGDELTPEPLDPYSTEGFFYREFLRKQDGRRRGSELASSGSGSYREREREREDPGGASSRR